MALPLVYAFGVGTASVELVDKTVVGGKGANLIEMARMGLPVPPGVIIPAHECISFLKPKPEYVRMQQVGELVDAVLAHFDKNVVPTLGYMPLLSVRSGARVSMPGMMDTLLNVGLRAAVASEWDARIGKACRRDCQHRLNETYTKLVGAPLPSLLRAQLIGAVSAVFKSWNSERAIEYRKMHGYPEDWGTAVTVQAMVFGNMNTESCSGVLFTRDPATGENFVVGEFLPEAQGEDVVAGVRTPQPLHEMEEWNAGVLEELLTVSARLEEHYRDAQDIEFTVQDGKLFVLQTRNAKRTAAAAFKIAHDMACEKLIDKGTAVGRVTAEQYATLLRARVAPGFKQAPTITGIAASPGLVSGVAVFDPTLVATVPSAILVRTETSPEDFPAMVKAAGILTSTGGMTSHAAVVARGINKPAVVGASGMLVTAKGATLSSGGVMAPGDRVTIDGATGNVWVNVEVPIEGGAVTPEAATVVRWAARRSSKLPAVEVRDVGGLPDAGHVYLNVSALTTAMQFRALIKELAARPALQGVIGFVRPLVPLSPEDRTFLELLAATNQTGGEDSPGWGKLFGVLTKAAGSKKVRAQWAIHVPQAATAEQVGAAMSAGWRLVRPVRTMAELLEADGLVVIDAAFRERMSTHEGVSLETLMATLGKAGRRVAEFGGAVAASDFVAEVLGK